MSPRGAHAAARDLPDAVAHSAPRPTYEGRRRAIQFHLSPSDWTFSYVGPGTPIYLPPGGGQTFWFGANGSNSGYFSGTVTLCIDWGHDPGLGDDSSTHAPICSPPFGVSFNTDHSICTQLFR